jgi:hypothetical protein
LIKTALERLNLAPLSAGVGIVGRQFLKIAPHEPRQSSVALDRNLADFLHQSVFERKRDVHKPIIRETLNKGQAGGEGYQVLKKWLRYREFPLLGRPLHSEEAAYFAQVVRRIDAVLLLGPPSTPATRRSFQAPPDFPFFDSSFKNRAV